MSVYESLSETQQFACRVIADHARSTAFAIADGILPGNEGRNYVLRKIMRRAIYHGREHLGLKDAFFYQVCDLVVNHFSGAFPELAVQRDFIGKMVRIEEERFGNTVTVGLGKLSELDISKETPLDDLFLQVAKLYDTFGTPRDLIRVYLEEKGIEFEEEDYNGRFESALQELQKQGGIGQTQRKSEISPIYADVLGLVGTNKFHGYDSTRLDTSKVVAILDGEKQLDLLNEGEQGSVVLDETPFYAESGGQVGDVGVLVGTGSGSDWGLQGAEQKGPLATASGSDRSPTAEFRASVSDTYSPVAGLIIHKVKVEKGSLKPGDSVVAIVDEEKRDATRRNHTATHLVHAALKEVLGSHVKQAGSVVAPNYLRFDFTHYQPISAEEIREVEDLVNRYILANHQVTTNMMAIEEAMRTGAVAMFGEKYGSDVRVLSVGDGKKNPNIKGVAVMSEVRTARHSNYDRIVFEFLGPEMPTYHIEYIDKPVRACGSGDTVPLTGDGWLEVRFTDARAHTPEGDATIKDRQRSPNLPVVKDLKITCDFEAEVTWVAGVASPNRYRVIELKSPTRLAVDMRH